MKDSVRAQALDLMEDGFDLHVHAAPSHRERLLDDFELALELDKYKMKGAITKSHLDSTAGRAMIANKYSGAKAMLYGAITLNLPAGGLNPYAVESALELGAKMVWLPTVDVKRGLSVLDQQGNLLQQVFQIFEVVKKYDVCLATGHIKPEESIVVCQEGIKCGVKMILTHPDAKNMTMPMEKQVLLARKGALIEKAWGNVYKGFIGAEEMLNTIHEIGVENIFLVSDFGSRDCPFPMEGIRDFIELLLKGKFAEEDIKKMVCTNPAYIIGART